MQCPAQHAWPPRPLPALSVRGGVAAVGQHDRAEDVGNLLFLLGRQRDQLGRHEMDPCP